MLNTRKITVTIEFFEGLKTGVWLIHKIETLLGQSWMTKASPNPIPENNDSQFRKTSPASGVGPIADKTHAFGVDCYLQAVMGSHFSKPSMFAQ